MNLLIVLPEERLSPSSYSITGKRAAAVYKLHQLKAGIKIKAAELNGKIGNAEVINSSLKEILIEGTFDTAPTPLLPLKMVIGISRPQTIKKIVQYCAMLGVGALHLIGSELGQKSYRSSKALQEENLLELGILGLEQSGNSLLPEVVLHNDCYDYFRTTNNSSSADLWIAHTRAERNLQQLISAHSLANPQVFAIGPEAGWSENEVELFCKRGYKSVSLGPFQLRVEVALVYAVALLTNN